MTQSLPPTTINFGEPESETEIRKRRFICRVCSKAFKRGEHCIRHERGHTQERPFSCQYCQKRYGRRDLLIRHQRILHTAQQPQGREKINTNEPTSLHFIEETGVDGQSPIHPVITEVDLTRSERALNHETAGIADEVIVEIPSDIQLQHDSISTTSAASHVDDLSPDDPIGIFGGEVPEFMDLLDIFADWPSQQIADFDLTPMDDQFTERYPPSEGAAISVQRQHASQQVIDTGFYSVTRSTFQDISLNAFDQKTSRTRDPPLLDCSSPQVIKFKSATVVIRFTENMRHNLLMDLSTRVSQETLNLLHQLSAVLIERCLQRYIEAFHIHVPIFHPSTLDFAKLPSPLILAMCSIGAVYLIERKTAAIFFSLAHESLGHGYDHQASKNFLTKWTSPYKRPNEIAPTPLWTSQSAFLLNVFAMLSGDPELSSMSIDRLGFFARDYRTRMIWFQSHNKNLDQLSWKSWIERESVKRLLHGHLYLCNLNSTLFGITSGFSMLTDGRVEMPCHHTLWDAPNAEKWRTLANARGFSSPLMVKDAVSRLLNGTYPQDIPEKYWIWDPYSCNVAVNAVSIYISHMVQGSHFLGEGSNLSEANSAQQAIITNQMEAAISKCLLLIKHARARGDNSYTWDETEGPLLFNSLAILRVSYCKIMTRADSVCRTTFFRDNELDFEASIQNFISEPHDWNKFSIQAVSVALEGIIMPTRVGSLLARKTAAFTWAIEHAFSGWDSILLVTKWLHAAEISQRQGFPLPDAEKHIIQKVCDMLMEEDESIMSRPSLAAELTRWWAQYYDDTWVWGVTPKMGHMLCELAIHYEAGATAG